jgi:hypothetical protein
VNVSSEVLVEVGEQVIVGMKMNQRGRCIIYDCCNILISTQAKNWNRLNRNNMVSMLWL